MQQKSHSQNKLLTLYRSLNVGSREHVKALVLIGPQLVAPKSCLPAAELPCLLPDPVILMESKVYNNTNLKILVGFYYLFLNLKCLQL